MVLNSAAGATGGRIKGGFRGLSPDFDAASASFPGRLMWHRRFDSRLTVDGEAHGPARGSPSAECARIVRDNEVQYAASRRRLRAPGSDGSARAAAAKPRQSLASGSQDDSGEDAQR